MIVQQLTYYIMQVQLSSTSTSNIVLRLADHDTMNSEAPVGLNSPSVDSTGTPYA